MAVPFSRAPTVISPERRSPTEETMIFSYTCVALTGTAIVVVLVMFCRYRVRRRAPVAVGGAEQYDLEEHHLQQVGADVAKLPEFAYTESARRSGGGTQCSVCLGAVHPGEKVRRLPRCRHLYHVECIDMWLASHTTCPLCRADVEPPVDDDGQAAAAEQEDQALPPV